MRAKALLLGATPPVVGPWIRISDAEAWTPVVETQPAKARLNGQVKFEVESPSGTRFTGASDLLGGARARVHVGEIEDVNNITILVEAQGG